MGACRETPPRRSICPARFRAEQRYLNITQVEQLANECGYPSAFSKHRPYPVGLAGLHPHELRHTAASLAIASGADIKVVQQMLGHSSATMTLDTCGHLFDDRLDEVSSALDRAGKSADLPARRAPARSLPAVAARSPKSPGVRPAVAQTLPDGGSDRVAARGEKPKSPGQESLSIGAPGRIRTFAPASGGRCSIP
jgi:hypothetical protein